MALTAAERLRFLVEVDARGAVAGFQAVGKAAEKELGKAENKLDKLGAGMVKGGAGAMAFAGVAGAALMGFAKAAEESELASLKLQNTLKNMPKLAGENADQFYELASAIQAKTVADDESVVSAMAMLGTFNLTAKEIKGVTPLVVDYARKFGVDLVAAATQVGKALDGNIGALKRNGVTIDAARFATDRYGAVVEALGQQVGGFAEAEGQTFSGQLEVMKNQAGELAEGIGRGVVPVMQNLMGVAQDVVGAFDNLSPEVQTGIGTFATLGTAALGAAGALSFTAGQVIKHRERFRQLFTTMEGGTRSLTNLGKAMTGATLAIGAAITIYSLYSAAKKKAEERTRDFVDALDLEGEAQKTALEELAKTDKGVREALVSLSELGFSVSDLEQYVNDGTGAFADFLAQLEQSNAFVDGAYNVENLNKVLKEMGVSSELSAFSVAELLFQAEALRADAKDTEVAVAAVAGATDELTDANGEAAAATETFTGSIKALVERIDEERDAVKKAEEALRNLIDAKREAFDAAYSVTKSTWEMQEALGAYTLTMLDSNSTEQERQEAVFQTSEEVANNAEEVARAADAIRIANGETALSAAETATIQIAELDKVIAKLGPDDPLRARLLELRNEYAEIPGTIYTNVVMDLNADAAMARLREIQALLAGIPRIGEIVIPAFASGTASAPGGVALVGEQGPELVNLPRGSRVNTASATRQMARSLTGTGTGTAAAPVTINVSSLDPKGAADAVIEAIRQYERRNGSGWRS